MTRQGGGMLTVTVLLGFGILLGLGCIQSWCLLRRVREATHAAQSVRHEMLTRSAHRLGFNYRVAVDDNLATPTRAGATARPLPRRNR